MYQNELKYRVNKMGCWICTSHTLDKDGYAIFQRNKKWQRIHRFMYEKKFGKIPKGKCVSHTCNNHSCINPKHLFSASIKEIKEVAKKENRIAFGERSGCSKLKKEQVIKIFKDRLTQQKVLAKRYNVNVQTIRDIWRNITWRNTTKDIKLKQTEEWLKDYREKRKKDWWEKWKIKNEGKMRKYFNRYEKNRRKIDTDYALKKRLRCRLRDALKKYTKTGKVKDSDEYGVNYQAIIEQLKPFPKDISKYDIDHILALCSFDLTNPKEIKRAFAPKNHRWLLKEENLKKSHQDRKLNIH